MSDSLDPFSSARAPPPAAGAEDSLAIAGAAAFVIVLVSSTIGWGLWMAYRTTKILSTATKARTAQRVRRRSGTTISEMAALEMGASFQKLDSCSNWEPTRLPYLQSQSSSLSKDMPALPERAFVSGWVPFPPSLPRCQTLDAVRSPMIVAHSTGDLCGVEGVLETSKISTHQAKESQNASSAPMNLINFDEEIIEQPAVPPTLCVGLGLSMIDVGVKMDGVTVPTTVEQLASLRMDVNLLESTSESTLSDHVTLDAVPPTAQLPSPLTTPLLPTLVLTSAPIKSILDSKAEQAHAVSQLVSPPATPTLLLTAPSIHCGLDLSVDGNVDLDVDDELESWSDVLEFQEYEDEDMSNRASMRLLSDFPSPPESPCFVPDVPRLVSIGHNDHYSRSYCGEGDGATAVPHPTPDEHVKTEAVEDKVEEKPFDYAAFRERLAVFLKDIKDQQEKAVPMLNIEDTDNQEASAPPPGDLPPCLSSSTHFDYARLRARKRSPTLLSHDYDKTATAPRVAPLRVGPRPLPLPEGFRLLLSPGVERFKCQASP